MATENPKDIVVTVRLPIELKAPLNDAAEKEHRSISNFIVHLLYERLERDGLYTRPSASTDTHGRRSKR